MKLTPLSEAFIEALVKVLGECGSGTDITRVLNDRKLADNSGESAKWRRLYWVFLKVQGDTQSPTEIFGFVQAFLTPVRFAGRGEEFEKHRTELNTVLVMEGIELGKDGKLRQVSAACTLDEAEVRVKTIRTKLQGRIIHVEVKKYCRKELMQENFFHAVFEASKGLAQRIREQSGADGDGAALIDKVFSVDKPILAFNSLQSETEKSEHKGFAALLKGCFAAIRNPLAHEPKILWTGEDDAADYLALISLLHRKLDGCVKIGIGV